jgi:chromosome segregation ATPase
MDSPRVDEEEELFIHLTEIGTRFKDLIKDKNVEIAALERKTEKLKSKLADARRALEEVEANHPQQEEPSSDFQELKQRFKEQKKLNMDLEDAIEQRDVALSQAREAIKQREATIDQLRVELENVRKKPEKKFRRTLKQMEEEQTKVVEEIEQLDREKIQLEETIQARQVKIDTDTEASGSERRARVQKNELAKERVAEIKKRLASLRTKLSGLKRDIRLKQQQETPLEPPTKMEKINCDNCEALIYASDAHKCKGPCQGRAAYCNATCAKEHWELEHRILCKTAK